MVAAVIFAGLIAAIILIPVFLWRFIFSKIKLVRKICSVDDGENIPFVIQFALGIIVIIIATLAATIGSAILMGIWNMTTLIEASL